MLILKDFFKNKSFIVEAIYDPRYELADNPEAF